MASRGGSRKREFSRRRKVGEKQEARWHASEHADLHREREERAEEHRGSVVYTTTFLADRGRG